MQDSNAIKSQITTVERQIGDKQMEIQTDQAAAQKEQDRLGLDVSDAMKHMTEPESEAGQQQSWQKRVDELQAQLQTETESMQRTQETHRSELDALQRQLTDLQRQYQEALQREQEQRIADMAA